MSIAAVTLNHVDKVFSFASQIRVNIFRRYKKKCIISKTAGNVRESSAVFCATERKESREGLALEGLEGILAETDKSQRLEERLKAKAGGCLNALLQQLGMTIGLQ